MKTATGVLVFSNAFMFSSLMNPGYAVILLLLKNIKSMFSSLPKFITTLILGGTISSAVFKILVLAIFLFREDERLVAFQTSYGRAVFIKIIASTAEKIHLLPIILYKRSS